MKHRRMILATALLLMATLNSFATFTKDNILTKIRTVKTSSINPSKKYIELQITNTTSDTLYLQQLSVNTFESSAVVYDNNKFDSSQFDSYILVSNFKGQLNEPNNPFRAHRDSYKEDKTFLAGNKNLPRKNIHNYSYYVIAPKTTVTIRTIVTVQTGEIARIPDMSTQERDSLSFHLGFKVKYNTLSNETSVPLWLQTEKSELLKKELIKWMY